MGLLLAHKRKISVYPDMVSISQGEDVEQKGGGRRKEIQVFSADSRFRLFRLLHRLEFDKVTFCTLTYPAVFPTEKAVYKANLKEYRRRFEDRFGRVPAVWRLEFQARGAPHYHIMYLDAPYVDIHDWCYLWSDVIHTYDMAHRLVGVDVKLVTSGKESKLVAFYLAKYVAKIDKRDPNCIKIKPGRWWGKWNITEAHPIQIELFDYQAEIITAALLEGRTGQTWRPADYSLCSVLGETMGTNTFQKSAVKVILDVIGRDRDKRHL